MTPSDGGTATGHKTAIILIWLRSRQKIWTLIMFGIQYLFQPRFTTAKVTTGLVRLSHWCPCATWTPHVSQSRGYRGDVVPNTHSEPWAEPNFFFLQQEQHFLNQGFKQGTIELFNLGSFRWIIFLNIRVCCCFCFNIHIYLAVAAVSFLGGNSTF